MPRAKTYSKEDVVKILEGSENRVSPVSGEPGHTLSMHVTIGLVSDRLMAKPVSSTQFPLIMDSTGKLQTKQIHRDVWKSITTGMNSAQANTAYSRNIENQKTTAGAFWDIQQAAESGRLALNSTAGQAELAKLDNGTADRVSISFTMPTGTNQVWKMRWAGTGNDIGHQLSTDTNLKDYSSVFVLVDKLGTDDIHIQTMFPVE